MPTQIPVEVFTQELTDLLDETFERVHGIYLDKGTSLFETLATISAEEASRPVSAGCACLAAQLAHVNFYLEVLERYLLTRESISVDWGEIWRNTKQVTPDEWSASQARLRQTYEHVLETLHSLEKWDNDGVSGAMAIVVHSAYHLGEIRQALCTLKQ